MKGHSVTRAFARGAAMGAFILTCFGAFWAFAALLNWPKSPAWAFGSVTLSTTALTVFSAVRFVTASKLPPAKDDAQVAHQGRAAGMWFAFIFAVEISLISAASISLARAGRPLLIPVVVAAIVGIHFLPLARVFHIPIYGGTGSLLLICSAGSLHIANEKVRLLVLGISVALVLWLSGAIVLVRYTNYGSSEEISRLN